MAFYQFRTARDVSWLQQQAWCEPKGDCAAVPLISRGDS